MTGLTAQIAHFATHSSEIRQPGSVWQQIRNGFVDTVATMLAGKDEPVVRILCDFVTDQYAARQEAHLLFGPRKVSARDAALINATAAHALDYDDVGLCGHPSAVLVPTLLAEGERLHASGTALMRAYLVGYETWAELIGRDSGQHHLKGWHPTGVFGVVGGAAAVASLRGVSADICAHALGLAASMAGGLVANFGSMAKPFHAGHAAAAAIDAVNLAEAGMTSAPDALEHRAGFLAALSPAGEVDLQRPAMLGHHFHRLGLTVKKYPVCFAAHRVIDAAMDLLRHGLQVSEIEGIHATVGVAQASMLRNHAPQSSLEAKFSLEFAIAGVLTAHRLGLTELHDAFVRRADVQALFKLVKIDTVTTVCQAEPSLAESDRLAIQLRDGRRFDSGQVFAARGSATCPLTDEELKAKFIDCAASVRWPKSEFLFEHLRRFEAVADVAILMNSN
jgi:2-methylcitrate dehydratase PrpD